MSQNQPEKPNGGTSKSHQAAKAKTCFVIAPIGDPGTPIRKRSDQVLRYIIEPAAKACGYDDVQRADKLASPGVITSQIIQLLLETDLVVADLTDHNANVFYELAIRHVVKKPIVQLIQSGLKIPFDVSQMRTIPYNLADPDDLSEARALLERQIIAVEKNPDLADNPITTAVEMKALAQSDDPVSKSNAEILTAVNEIRNEIADVRNYLVHQPITALFAPPSLVTTTSLAQGVKGVWANTVKASDIAKLSVSPPNDLDAEKKPKTK
jgi:hypothetical protein